MVMVPPSVNDTRVIECEKLKAWHLRLLQENTRLAADRWAVSHHEGRIPVRRDIRSNRPDSFLVCRMNDQKEGNVGSLEAPHLAAAAQTAEFFHCA